MPNKYHGRSTRKFQAQRKRILETNNICWLCGQAGADTIDHIVPLSVAPHMGEDTTNMMPAHRTCNSRRGTKPVDGMRNMPASRTW